MNIPTPYILTIADHDINADTAWPMFDRVRLHSADPIRRVREIIWYAVRMELDYSVGSRIAYRIEGGPYDESIEGAFEIASASPLELISK